MRNEKLIGEVLVGQSEAVSSGEDKSLSRRTFISGASIAGVTLATLALGGQAVAFGMSTQSETLRPPGAQSETDFLARCVRCGKCIEACPHESIFAIKDFFSATNGTPTIDTRAKACRMCHNVPCVPACPTGALRDVEKPEEINMGYAVVDRETCISFKGLRCEVCYRACPLIDRAITIDYRKNENDSTHSIFAPIIDQEQCTGCGLCVERCITDEPAIRIVREGWTIYENEQEGWVPSARENLPGPQGEGVWIRE